MTRGLPPGPPLPAALQLPLLGLALLTGRLDGAALSLLRRRYGDMFTVVAPGTNERGVFVCTPELIKQVLAGDPKTLHAGEGSPLGAVLGRNSLLAIDEERHMEQRKLLLPPFHGERMRVYESIVEEEALRELDSWPRERPFRTLEPMMRITLNVILRAVFGVRSGPLMDELRVVMPATVALGSRLAGLPFLHRDLGPHSPWGRFVRLRRRFDWGVNALVDKARHDPRVAERTDVLSLLAQARHEDDGSPMSDAEIADQLSTVLAAGHETTATTLAWAVERIRRHPDLLERLVAEADAGESTLREATIREVQRTRPVIPGFGREVMRPFELGNYELPPGTLIMAATPVIHNDPASYPQPHLFDPDRFVGRRPNPYAWVPFGGGVRRCPGAAFAHMEMDVVLRTVLRSLELQPTRARGERSFFRGVAFSPGDGGLAVAAPRLAARPPQAPRRLAAVA